MVVVVVVVDDDDEDEDEGMDEESEDGDGDGDGDGDIYSDEGIEGQAAEKNISYIFSIFENKSIKQDLFIPLTNLFLSCLVSSTPASLSLDSSLGWRRTRREEVCSCSHMEMNRRSRRKSRRSRHIGSRRGLARN